jgi:hypothetical protein
MRVAHAKRGTRSLSTACAGLSVAQIPRISRRPGLVRRVVMTLYLHFEQHNGGHREIASFFAARRTRSITPAIGSHLQIRESLMTVQMAAFGPSVAGTECRKVAEAVWKHACGHGAGGSVCAGERHRWTVEQQHAQRAPWSSLRPAAIDAWQLSGQKRGA